MFLMSSKSHCMQETVSESICVCSGPSISMTCICSFSYPGNEMKIPESVSLCFSLTWSLFICIVLATNNLLRRFCEFVFGTKRTLAARLLLLLAYEYFSITQTDTDINCSSQASSPFFYQFVSLQVS